ncbi:pantothenate kinase [Stutzerimonas stutzeri TS44]|nr:pantothenate kinase [Stutzerimonas stutzeri TS44]
MILELDCGNSLIKWRALQAGSDTPLESGVVASLSELLDGVSSYSKHLVRGRLVSVRGEVETKRLCSSLERSLNISISCAHPSRELAGVINGYDDYACLGLDRWLAVVAAYNMKRRAALVLDLGTAVTADLVNDAGVHLGGYIAPGMPLLRHQLQTHTRRVRYDSLEAESAAREFAPGRSTAEAVERGCLMMLRSFVKTQIDCARATLGDDVILLATGGDAVLIADTPAVLHVQDLVFRGLAVACP